MRPRARGLALGIATTRPTVKSLFAAAMGPDALSWFAPVRTGEDVKVKKPDPEFYLKVLP